MVCDLAYVGKFVYEVRFECLGMFDCEQRYKINYCLCSSSHYLQDRDTDATCESQGITFEVHMEIDKR